MGENYVRSCGMRTKIESGNDGALCQFSCQDMSSKQLRDNGPEDAFSSFELLADTEGESRQHNPLKNRSKPDPNSEHEIIQQIERLTKDWNTEIL